MELALHCDAGVKRWSVDELRSFEGTLWTALDSDAREWSRQLRQQRVTATIGDRRRRIEGVLRTVSDEQIDVQFLIPDRRRVIVLVFCVMLYTYSVCYVRAPDDFAVFQVNGADSPPRSIAANLDRVEQTDNHAFVFDCLRGHLGGTRRYDVQCAIC